MELTHQDLEELTWIILEKLKEEFQTKYMSKNLVNTVEVKNQDDKIEIIIPAKVYNMLKFQKEGVVIHTGKGSYASKLDKEGSEFYAYPQGTKKGSKRVKPGNHKDYVDRVIEKAVNEWMAKQGKFDSKKVTEISK